MTDAPYRPIKTAAFSQYPHKELTGHSIRRDRYRYTEWSEGDKQPEGVELYDHRTDDGENFNLANKPECRQIVAEMAKKLYDGWRAARSPASQAAR